MAKNEKCKQQRQHKLHPNNKREGGRQVWRTKSLQKDINIKVLIVRFTRGSQPFNKTLVGEVNAIFEKWLSRSLVCTTNEPLDLVNLASTIVNGYGQFAKI